MVFQLSLFSMVMRKRLLCYAHPTRPDLESSSKKMVDYHGPRTVYLSNGNAEAPVLSHSPQRARPGDLVSRSYFHLLFGDFALPW